jgi:hypothetical protein
VDGNFSSLNGFKFSFPISRLLVVLCLRPILSILASSKLSFRFNIFNSVGCSISNYDDHRKRNSLAIFNFFVSKLEANFNSFISLSTLNLKFIIKETSEAIWV